MSVGRGQGVDGSAGQLSAGEQPSAQRGAVGGAGQSRLAVRFILFLGTSSP